MGKNSTKKDAEEKAERFETTDGVAKKIYEGVRKGKIVFGKCEESSDAKSMRKFWKASPLPNGAKVSLSFEHKHGNNKKGTPFNPRYKIQLEHNKQTDEFSGTYARKIFLRLENPPKKRTTELTDESKSFVGDALADL
jgi:hypothetical protein